MVGLLSNKIFASLYTNDVSEKNISFVKTNEKGQEYIFIGKPLKKAIFTLGLGFAEKSITSTGIIQLTYETNVTFYNLKLLGYLTKGNLSREINSYLELQFKMSNKVLSYPAIYSWSLYRIITDQINKQNSFDIKTLLGTGYGLAIYSFKFSTFTLKQAVELSLAYEYASLENYKNNLGSGYLVSGTEFDLDSKKVKSKTSFVYRKTLIRTGGPSDQGDIYDQSHLELHQEFNYRFSKKFYGTTGLNFINYTNIKTESQQKKRKLKLWLGFSYQLSN